MRLLLRLFVQAPVVVVRALGGVGGVLMRPLSHLFVQALPNPTHRKVAAFVLYLLAGIVAVIVLTPVTPAAWSLVALFLGYSAARTPTRFDSTVQPFATTDQVRLGELVFGVTSLVALGALPSAPTVAHGVGGALVVGGIVFGGRQLARRHQKWQPTGTVFGLVADSWGRLPGRSPAAVMLVGSVVLGGALNVYQWGGPVLGVILAVVAGRPYWAAARQDAETRVTVSETLSGSMAGGQWTPLLREFERSPIGSLDLTDDGVPAEIVVPIPTGMAASAQPDVEVNIVDRLAGWGTYSVKWHTGGPGGKRRAVIKWWPPLDDLIYYDGRAGEGRKVWLGRGKVNREMLEVRPDATVGSQEDVFLNFAETPHALIVGTTGGGKSVIGKTVMLQWILAGNYLVICDPKRIGFNQFKGKRGVLKVATDRFAIRDTICAARDEMEARYVRMEETGIDNIMNLLKRDRPIPLLVFIDELTEAMSVDKVAKDDEEGNARNDAAYEIRAAVSQIVRLGRAAGVHVLALTQRADVSDGIAGSTKNNLEFRVLVGSADKTARLMGGFADSKIAATPGKRGRGIAGRPDTAPIETQFAWAPDEDLDRFLAEHDAAEDTVAYGDAGVTVLDAVAATQSESGKLEVLRSARIAGKLTDDDAKSLGYENAGAVDEQLAAYDTRCAVADADVDAAVEEQKAVVATEEKQALAVISETFAHQYDVYVPNLTLDQVGGYEDLKQQLVETVGTAFSDATSAEFYGVETGGVLLYGDPGVGKTFIAEALAGTLGVRFLKVSVGDLTGGFVGDGSSKIREAVDAAERFSPCILLIDEIDAVAGRRDDETNSEGRKSVNEILVQLDRVRRMPGVVVMATTNHVDRLDPAVIRDGRMTARIRIDLPNEAARESILLASLTNRPVGEVAVGEIAQRTQGYTPAMLTAVVDAGARAAMRDGKRLVVTEDLLAAIRERGGQDRPTVESAGLDSVVLPPETEAELRQVLGLLTDPERAKAFGIKVPTGLLLYGDPGVGKTVIAKALAAEAQTSFYAVKPSQWASKWQGESERQVRELFERARVNAPSIVFIDEIDSIGGRRGEHDDNGSARILTAMLAEMDGFGSGAAGGAPVFVIGATNLPDTLDAALVRPGRLSRSIEIGLPDEAGRLELLRRFSAEMTLATDVDLYAIAGRTVGYSPAALSGVCQQAGMAAERRAGDSREVDAAAFDEALSTGKASTASALEGLDAASVTPVAPGGVLDDWLSSFPADETV